MNHLVSSSGIDQTYLRISVTDRCNLRCSYCMPPGGRKLVNHEDLLTYEELAFISRILAGMGISKIRITGGEPLVRKDLPRLAAELSSLAGVKELCLTTNGTMLFRLARELRTAGITRINVSLDSLRPDRFREITGSNSLDEVLKGLEISSGAGFSKIKINTILFQGINEDEIKDFVKFSARHGFIQRFIELMPFRIPASKGVTEAVIRERLEPGTDQGAIEFISQISNPFCKNCGRLRLDSKGRLKTCLLSKQVLDLRSLVRSKKDEGLIADEISVFVRTGEKRLAEEISAWEARASTVAMSEIGG